MNKHQLKNNPQQRQAPDHHHQAMRQRRLQPHQQKRRIGTGNQQIDGAVIQFFQPEFGTRVWDRVVQRRGEKQQDHTAAVQAVANNRQRARVSIDSLAQQQHQSNDAEDAAHAVADAVGNLFRQRVSLS
ncbi:hypothetical protein HA44_03480 [Mixta gaviniae]|nr:hypothetical protein HA44_03480 [Mixta gaviniae]